MTRLAKVVWKEGMHLAQHHFQTQSRYFEESIRFAVNQLYFEPYGLSAAGFDAEALLNGVLSVTHARGILPDGTPFEIPEADPPPEELDIRAVFQPTDHQQTVFLALPPLRPGDANCAPETGPEHRFAAVEEKMLDETTGLDEKPVTLARKNLHLLLESQTAPDLIMLPVARITRDGSGRFVYDPAFVPPCVQISASERLMKLLAELVETLERKAETLTRERRAGGDSLAEYHGKELASFWLAHTIHSALAPLRYHLESRGSHPEQVFLELARLAGALCTFSLRADPGSVPRYDHENLEVTFTELDRHIREHLEITMPTTCETVPLQPRGARGVFTASVREDMCTDQAQWILGVRSQEKLSRVVSSVVSKVKFSSKTDLPKLVQTSGMAGLPMEHLSAPPRELAPRVGWEYFLIKKSGYLWTSIRDSLDVGLWVPEELVDADLGMFVVLRPQD